MRPCGGCRIRCFARDSFGIWLDSRPHHRESGSLFAMRPDGQRSIGRRCAVRADAWPSRSRSSAWDSLSKRMGQELFKLSRQINISSDWARLECPAIIVCTEFFFPLPTDWTGGRTDGEEMPLLRAICFDIISGPACYR